MRRIAFVIVLSALVGNVAQAQESPRLSSSEVEIVESDSADESACTLKVFVRGATLNASSMIFPTIPCWRIFPTFAGSYNLESKSYEMLAGLGTKFVAGERRSFEAYLTYAHTKGGENLIWFVGGHHMYRVRGLTCRLDAFGVGYVPLDGGAKWQHGLDFIRVSCPLGPVSLGPVAYLWYAEGGSFERGLGPALKVQIPKVGQIQIDILLDAGNWKDVGRVGYAFEIPLF